MTTSVNPTLSTIETIFKDLIWTPLVQAGEKWLQTQAPFLALPVISSLFTGTVNAITDAVYAQLVLFIDVTAITLLNEAHQAAYTTASEQLVVIAAQQGVTSAAYLQAQQTAITALSKFTQLN